MPAPSGGNIAIPAIGTISDPAKVRVALVQGQQIISAPATALSDAVGVPAGGTSGQVLTKSSDDNYDSDWADIPAQGDVTGPASSTDGNLASFDGATGKIIKDSGKKTADFATAGQGAKADTAVQPSGIPALLTSDLPAALLGLGQIPFPATQIPSSDANTLDDYEEGTWTATLAFGGASTGIVYSAQSGTYIKIGRLVYVFARITLTNKGTSTGLSTITGLPFASNIPGMMATINYYTGLASLTGVPIAEVTGAILTIRQTGAATVSSVTQANFTNTSDIIVSAVYTTTS